MTLYRHRDFVIDVYFWLSPQTAIHSHTFQGAFTVLKGNSLQSEYDFEIGERIQGKQVLVGNLSLRKVSLLHQGGVREILPGPRFIHQVWHLGFPTISLAIRTARPRQIPQYRYFIPHLALQYKAQSSFQRRRLDLMTMLWKTGRPVGKEVTQELIRGLSLHQALSHWIKNLETGDLRTKTKGAFQDWATAERWSAQIVKGLGFAQPLALALRARTGPPARGLKPRASTAPEPRLEAVASAAVKCFHRHSRTQIDWSQIHNEGERLLLALLSSGPKRNRILDVIREYAPENRPEVSLIGWLRNLMKRRVIGFGMNQTGQDILKLLIRGYREDEICRKLSRRRRVKSFKRFRREVGAFSGRLLSLELLKPLWH